MAPVGSLIAQQSQTQNKYLQKPDPQKQPNSTLCFCYLRVSFLMRLLSSSCPNSDNRREEVPRTAPTKTSEESVSWDGHTTRPPRHLIPGLFFPNMPPALASDLPPESRKNFAEDLELWDSVIRSYPDPITLTYTQSHIHRGFQCLSNAQHFQKLPL